MSMEVMSTILEFSHLGMKAYIDPECPDGLTVEVLEIRDHQVQGITTQLWPFDVASDIAGLCAYYRGIEA